ncbi:MAG: hypothetical protein JNM63_09305 [Spirochaetia bacterium]|nr:hypothetical protein [Spirochaetia bacterium]
MLPFVYRRFGGNGFLIQALAGLSLFIGFAPRQSTLPAVVLSALISSLVFVYLMKGSPWLMRLSQERKSRIRSCAVYFSPILFLIVPLRLASYAFPVLTSTASLVCVLAFVFLLSRHLLKRAGLSAFEIAKFWMAPFLLACSLIILLILGFFSSLLRDFV